MSIPPEKLPPLDPLQAVYPEQTEIPQPEDPFPAIGRILLDVFETLVLALVLYFAIDAVVARVRVLNISMVPTLVPGELVMVNKLAYKLGEMERGDIIVFHYSESEDYVKRLIGLPGDEIEMQNGIVYISGRPMIETYLNEVPTYSGKWTVPEGKIFVLGDNRNASSDSHNWGFVPVDEVMGRAVLIYWPLDKVRFFTRE
ncbi:MAG: signal peptidase I [Pseudomonadales bacterium]|nr:signal peptidase I [Pseudomonadales bacterium]